MQNVTPRALFRYGFLLSFAMVFASLYFEFAQGLLPCVLCELQRLIAGFIAVLFLVGCALRSPYIIRLHAGLITLLAAVGLTLSARQVWLQYASDSPQSCLPKLSYLVTQFPLLDVIQRLFEGSSDCATVDWTFLGLSMAGWSLCGFVCLTLLAVAIVFHRQAR